MRPEQVRPKRTIRGVAVHVIAASIALAVLVLSPVPYVELASRLANRLEQARADMTYWPGSSVASAVGVISVEDSVADRDDERLYLARVSELLDEAIGSRLKVDRVLRSRRSAAEYRTALADFRERQLRFLERLSGLRPPSRLIPFHHELRDAALEQIAFYAAFVAAKTRDASVEVDHMLEHPALRASSRGLHEAREHLRRLHPAVDDRLEASMEGQLSWFDAI